MLQTYLSGGPLRAELTHLSGIQMPRPRCCIQRIRRAKAYHRADSVAASPTSATFVASGLLMLA